MASALAIDAPSGTKISQGTPRCRAAKATAWAWLPALPATTPSCACGPRSRSLDSAPLILNEPVLCRLSALSTTFPPMRSPMVVLDTIGVRLTTPSPAMRACRMSSGSSPVRSGPLVGRHPHRPSRYSGRRSPGIDGGPCMHSHGAWQDRGHATPLRGRPRGPACEVIETETGSQHERCAVVPRYVLPRRGGSGQLPDRPPRVRSRWRCRPSPAPWARRSAASRP